MNRSHWLIKSILLTFYLLIAAGFIWCFFYFLEWKTAPSSPLSLAFTNDKSYTLSFEGSFSWFETHIDREKNGELAFSGSLQVRSQTIYQGASYKFKWKKLTIYDKENDALVLSYTKHSPTAITYSTDPKFTEGEREHIFKKFNINYTDNSPFNDTSLFTHSFYINLHKQGLIQNIELPTSLRNPLYNLIRRALESRLFWELLTTPEHLPPLFPEKGKLTQSPFPLHWVTEGKLKKPIRLTHRYIPSTSLLREIKSEGESTDQHYLFNWKYHTLLRKIPEFSLSWNFHTNRSNINTFANYTLIFTCLIE